jgi:hypothetical protein
MFLFCSWQESEYKFIFCFQQAASKPWEAMSSFQLHINATLSLQWWTCRLYACNFLKQKANSVLYIGMGNASCKPHTSTQGPLSVCKLLSLLLKCYIPSLRLNDGALLPRGCPVNWRMWLITYFIWITVGCPVLHLHSNKLVFAIIVLISIM